MRNFSRHYRDLRVLRKSLHSDTIPCSRPTIAATSQPRLPSSRASQTHSPFSRYPTRAIHTSTILRARSKGNDSASPGPTSFGDLDVLGNTPAPSTSVDVCMYDGFGLNSGITIRNGNGALLVNGEAFAWKPWEAKGVRELVNKKGQFDIPAEAFGVFDVLWPRPDLLVIGVGKQNMPLSPQTRQHISRLGMRVEVLDTRNAAAQFNLLATERGVLDVAAALIPIGWKEGVGAV